MCLSKLVGNGGWGQLLKNESGEKQQGAEHTGMGGFVNRAMGSQRAGQWYCLLFTGTPQLSQGKDYLPSTGTGLTCSQQSPIHNTEGVSERPCYGRPCPPIHTLREDIVEDGRLEDCRGCSNELCLGEWEGTFKRGLGLKAATFHFTLSRGT